MASAKIRRRVGEDARALRLEVDRPRLGTLAARLHVAEETERRPGFERVLRHHPQEPLIVARDRVQPRPQVVRERGLAPERPEVEEDVRVQQRLRMRVPDPLAEPHPPLGRGEAPPRVARHDVALAQREAAGVERRVDRGGERQQPRPRGVGGPVGVEHDGVVLIAREGLLVPAFAAEREPAEADAAEVVPLRLEHEDALGEPIVQRRDELRQRLRAHALREHASRQRPDLGGGALQAREIVRDLDRRDHLAHRLPLQGEEAPLRHDADELPAVAHEQVPDAVTRHHERRFVQRRARRQVDRIGRHVGADRVLERQPAGWRRGGRDPAR